MGTVHAWWVRVSRLGFGVFILSCCAAAISHAAALRSLGPQIIPNIEASIGGEQFAANEMVVVREFRVIPGDGTLVLPTSQRIQAAADGNFQTGWTFRDAGDGVEVYLEAVGQSSGQTAQFRVHLSKSILTFTRETEEPFCLDTITNTASYLFTAKLEFVCGDGSRVPLPNRIVEFFPIFGSCDDLAEDKKFGGGWTNADGVLQFTLSGLDTLLVDTGLFSVVAVYDGEKKPSWSQPGNSPCNPNDRVDISGSSACIETAVVNDCSTNDGFTILPTGAADVFYVHTVDLDRDNYTDAIYTGEAQNGLFISFGSASGSFWPPQPFLDVKLAAVTADYINADTLIDIIASTTSMTYYLLNQGARQFTVDSVPSSAAFFARVNQTASNDQSNATSTPSIVSGYFNDDDLLDLVVAPGLFFEGTATANFFSASLLPFGLDVVDECDFNGDGKLDLVITNENQLSIMLNDGQALFTPSYQTTLDGQSAIVPPVFAVSDINTDGFCDVAIVLPLASLPGSSRVTIVYGNGSGGALQTQSITFAGLAFNLVLADLNKDNELDIVVADGDAGKLRIFLQVPGGWSVPLTINLETTSNLTYALATLDLDRDGNYDFVTGGLGGGNLIVALDEQPGAPILADEMTVTGLSYLNIKVINPNGFSVSEQFQSIAGSDYQSLDVNGDGQIDERTLDYNLQEGTYCIVAKLEPDAPSGGTFSVGVGIDGSQQLSLADDFNPVDPLGRRLPEPGDSIVYCFDIAEINAVSPANGSIISKARPVFEWSALLALQEGNAGRANVGKFDFQLSRTIDFRSVKFEQSGIATPSYQLPFTLGNDTTWYWRIREIDGADTAAYSNIFIVRVANLCCLISSGNLNGDILGNVDISDIVLLIDYLFVSGTPLTPCDGLGDVDGNGRLDISDITAMVDVAFNSGSNPLKLCP